MIAQRQGKLLWVDVATREMSVMAEFDVFSPAKNKADYIKRAPALLLSDPFIF